MQQETAGEVVVLGALEGAEHDRPGNVAASEVGCGGGWSARNDGRSSAYARGWANRCRRSRERRDWIARRCAVCAGGSGSRTGGQPAHADAAGGAPGVAGRARAAGQLLGADPVAGAALSAATGQLRDGAPAVRRCAWRPRTALTQRRFETGPGEQAQVRLGPGARALRGGPTEVHIFVMTLGYSRRGCAEGYVNERMGACWRRTSTPSRTSADAARSCYDRMRTVVLGAEREGRPRWNPTFAAFARHWGFKPRLCRPYRAQTKGKVESGVKYVKRNFVPGRVFRDLEDFNAQLAAWQAEVADVRIHGTTHQRPIDRFADEADALAPTAGQPSFLQAMRARARGRRRLAGVDRRQPLLGAVAADRQDGAGGARRRARGSIRHRGAARGRACGAGRPRIS